MREILFRGKRIDNGEWVYGVPVIGKTSGVFMVWIEAKSKSSRNTLSLRDVVRQAEVIPETVGPYTGLDDKNDVKIFEGDILKGAMRNLIVAYKGAGFIAYWNDHDYGYGTEKMWCNLVEGGEVIGNIHDNPELIGETK